VIAVRDLAAAARAYATMLGRAPSWRGRHPTYGTANVIFGLGNCYVELLGLERGARASAVEPSASADAIESSASAGALDETARAHPIARGLAAYLQRRAEGIFALAFGCDDLAASAARLADAGITPGPIVAGEAVDAGGSTRRWRSFTLDRADTHGIMVFAITHDDRAAIAPSPTDDDARATVTDVDHVVLFSDDLAGALALWRDTFGIAERWRREFSERGTVNVGLRLGGVTLELVAPLGSAAPAPKPRGERAWGLAYRVSDVDAAVVRLRGTDVPVGDARTGLAPNTRVATVKWQDRLPTLLIQHRAQV
jgi:catechol 2,3-dioxygenase-like lactoylglutathione lyase family enzyme